MRICLVAPERPEWGRPGDGVEALATLLAARHEVEVIRAEHAESLDGVSFACPEHRRAAETMEAIRAAYPECGPDYIEVGDNGARGLIALQARATGDPLLWNTVMGVRVGPCQELIDLNDRTLRLPEARIRAELEREQLRLADAFVWPGGEWLETYRRHYGDLPPQFRIPGAVDRAAPAASAAPPHGAGEGPLRILFAGPFSRQSGSLDLIEACLGLSGDDWELTMCGADTATAAMGQSVRDTVEVVADGDPRLRVEGPASSEGLAGLLGEHDLLVVPARLGDSPAATLAALWAGVPILATPTGEQTTLAAGTSCVRLTAGVGVGPLRESLNRLLADPERLREERRGGACRERFEALADPEPVLAGYERLFAATCPPPMASVAGSSVDREEPLVSGVVPYYGAAAHVADAVGSVLAQTYRKLEVVLVNDGSFEAEDAILEELASDPRVTVVTQPNRGETAARWLGVVLARGEFVLTFDADNVLDPCFVERALLAFRRQPDLAYVSCWLRFFDPDGADLDIGYAPLGNGVVVDDEQNWDGDTLALMRRDTLVEEGFHPDPGSASCSDWERYRMLRIAGRFGAVIPEPLLSYRILPESITQSNSRELHDRAWAETRARLDRLRDDRVRGDG